MKSISISFFFTCSHMTFIVWSVCLYVNLFVAVLTNSLLVYLDRCICLFWASLLVSVCKQEFVCIYCCVNQFNHLFVFEFCWLISVFVCLYLLVCQLVYLFEFALCWLIKLVYWFVFAAAVFVSYCQLLCLLESPLLCIHMNDLYHIYIEQSRAITCHWLCWSYTG